MCLYPPLRFVMEWCVLWAFFGGGDGFVLCRINIWRDLSFWMDFVYHTELGCLELIFISKIVGTCNRLRYLVE